MAPSSTRMRSVSARLSGHASTYVKPPPVVQYLTPMTTPLTLARRCPCVDLSRVLAGPFCGMLLSDLGADVIKVEDTGSGDESRTWPPHKDGESAAFLVINRNKRDMTLDLKAPEGVDVLKR